MTARASQSLDMSREREKNMISPAQNSTIKPNTFSTKLTEQEIIHQTQAELLALIRVSPDEAIENWRQPVRLGNWSGTLESEIYHILW